jgi:hypothetical protein
MHSFGFHEHILSIQLKPSFKLILEKIYTVYKFKASPSSQRTGRQEEESGGIANITEWKEK